MTGSSPQSLVLLEQFLVDHPLVKYVQVQLVDYGGVTRGLSLTLDRAREIAAGSSRQETVKSTLSSCGPSLRLSFQTGALWLDEIARTGADDIWHPDFSTLHAHPTMGTQAVCSAWVEEGGRLPGKQYNLDPRSILKSIEEESRQRGISFLTGYEIEYELFPVESDSQAKADIASNYLATAVERSMEWQVCLDVMDILTREGIQVWRFHPEARKTSHEISLYPATPLLAADNLAYVQETIRSVSYKHGFHATFYPKATSSGPTIGNHIHISVNTLDGKANSDCTDKVLGGWMEYFSALSAYLLAGHDSYDHRSVFYGHGLINFSSYRFITPLRRYISSRSHFEFRLPDYLTNPHLQLAAIIATGLLGLDGELDPGPECPWRSMSPIPEDAFEENNIWGRFPSSQITALDALQKRRTSLERYLGDSVQAYIDYKKAEHETLRGTEVEWRRKTITRFI